MMRVPSIPLEPDVRPRFVPPPPRPRKQRLRLAVHAHSYEHRMLHIEYEFLRFRQMAESAKFEIAAGRPATLEANNLTRTCRTAASVDAFSNIMLARLKHMAMEESERGP